MPGPIPKRSEERRRRNKPDRPVDRVAIGSDIDDLFGDGAPDPELENRIQGEDLPPAEKPDADYDNWHPLAIELYESLSESGQKIFYEASDWAIARVLCESLSRDLQPQWINTGTPEEPKMEKQILPLKGANLSAYLKGFAALGMTEGDRRRMSIELSRKAKLEVGDLPAGVVSIDRGREDMFG